MVAQEHKGHIIDQVVVGTTIFSKERFSDSDNSVKYFIRSLEVPKREETTEELFNIAKEKNVGKR